MLECFYSLLYCLVNFPPFLQVDLYSMKTTLYTGLALLAFAGNSVLCRIALSETNIDAASFTGIRLMSGAVALAIILKMSHIETRSKSQGSWKDSFLLFIYAITFSYAYITLETGIGALILFASVQMTMIIANLLSGQRLHYLECVGLIAAFSGFVYLIYPDLSSPSVTGFILMVISGIAWAIYTLSCRASGNALADTAYNFIKTLPFVLVLTALSFQQAILSWDGVLLAVLSGAIASGIGYTIWSMAVGGLSITQAAVVQLLVPVIAAVGGLIFADEVLSYRLVLSSLIIIGGILTVIIGKRYSTK